MGLNDGYISRQERNSLHAILRTKSSIHLIGFNVCTFNQIGKQSALIRTLETSKSDHAACKYLPFSNSAAETVGNPVLNKVRSCVYFPICVVLWSARVNVKSPILLSVFGYSIKSDCGVALIFLVTWSSGLYLSSSICPELSVSTFLQDRPIYLVR